MAGTVTVAEPPQVVDIALKFAAATSTITSKDARRVHELLRSSKHYVKEKAKHFVQNSGHKPGHAELRMR